MSPPLVKIVWIDTAPFKDKPELIEGALKAGSDDDVCTHFYTGTQKEDVNIAVWLSVFTSQADHDALLAGSHPAKQYQSQLFANANTESGPRVVCANLIHPIETLEKAIAAPVVEVAEIRLKPENSTELGELIRRLTDTKDAMEKGVAHAVASARKVGDETTFVVFVGWESVQAHIDAAAEGTTVGTLVREFMKIATVDYMKHATFTKHK